MPSDSCAAGQSSEGQGEVTCHGRWVEGGREREAG